MQKLVDETDLKILAHLDLDVRAPVSKIAKEIGLSPNAVKTRIEKMRENGIIFLYFVYPDLSAIGYNNYLTYFNFKNVDNKIESEMLDYLVKSKHTWLVLKFRGKYDVMTIFWAKTPHEYYKAWKEFRVKYRKYIRNSEITPFFGFTWYGYPFTKRLLGKSNEILLCTDNKFKVSKKDIELLEVLTLNARTPLSELSKKSGISESMIKYKMDKFIKSGVIRGFMLMINPTLLGYIQFKVEFYLRSSDKLAEIEDRIKEEPGICYLMQTGSDADIETFFFANSYKDIDDTINKIRETYSSEINNYKISTVIRPLKVIPLEFI
jgi:DNA-binding Lrp family transcriptional regulator